jgi:hypothetical protein
VVVIPGDYFRVKVVKGEAIVFPLAQHGVPTQSCLGGFQREELKQTLVVMNGHGPFSVMILDVISFGEINPWAPVAACACVHEFLSGGSQARQWLRTAACGVRKFRPGLTLAIDV